MPRVNVTITPAPGIGAGVKATEVAADAANNHKVANAVGSRVLLFVVNEHVAAVQATIKHLELPVDADDIVTSVPAGETYVFGPFPASLFTQSSGPDVGFIQVDLDIDTATTLFAISF